MEKKNPSVSLSDDGLNVQKPEKASEASNGNHFREVEEKLNKLLDPDGSISLREDALKGFLELLLRGATKTIQRNRDLSMILDALLKTRSRYVLVYIVNKNGGLRMLRKWLNQFKSDFPKTPIIRKLLKVLEYLAERQILTSERIKKNSKAMESFRESLLSLTEHEDKQVHQIARKFRDKWIPKYLRRPVSEKPEFSKSSNYNSIGSACVGKSSDSIKCVKQSAPSMPDIPVSQSSVTRNRKRKSLWDQTTETFFDFSTPRHKVPKTEPKFGNAEKSVDRKENGRDQDKGDSAHEKTQILSDAQPGFSCPTKPYVPVSVSSVTRTHKRKSQWDQRPAETYFGFSAPQHKVPKTEPNLGSSERTVDRKEKASRWDEL